MRTASAFGCDPSLMRLRFPSWVELLLQVALVAILALMISDHFSAAGAACDGVSQSPWCGLFGGDNPAADFWDYKSQETYLRASLAEIAVLTAALLAPFFLPDSRWGICALILVLVVGEAALHWLGPLIL